MASARKKVPNPRGLGRGDQYRILINGIMDGTIQATRAYETRRPDGTTELEYDEPEQGQGNGNQAARSSAQRRST